MNQHYLYRLWLNGELQYIGQTNNMKQRTSEHRRDKLFDAVDYILVDENDIDKIEMYFIKKYLPPLNNSLIDNLATLGCCVADKYETCEFIKMPYNFTSFVEFDEAKNTCPSGENTVIPNILLSTANILNKETGVLQELTLSDKVIYCYIKDNARYVLNGNNVMCESQSTVGNVLLMDRKTINRGIKKLENVGLVEKFKYKTFGAVCQAYFIVPFDCGKFKFCI